MDLNRVLFSSCRESNKPIEIVSLSNQLEVSISQNYIVKLQKKHSKIVYISDKC